MKLTNNIRRILSALLVLVLVFSMLPVSTFAASGDIVDAAIIFSDLHTKKSDYKESTLKNVMTAVKNAGLPVSSVTSAGDAFSVNEDSSSSNGPYTGKTSTLTNAIQSVLGNVPVNYVWSDHDRYAVQADGSTLLDKTSRLVYGAGNDGVYGTDDDDNYYVYSLSMGDLCSYDRYKAGFNTDSTNNRANNGFTATVDQAVANFVADAANLKKDRPLFIASHQPLFDNRNDNAFAEKWFDAINKVATEMDVAFFYGHNHKYDTGNDYYYAKGSTMPVTTTNGWNGYQTNSGWQYTNGDPKSVNKTLNFTHMCAGYLAPSSTGSTSSTTREGTLIAITIYEDSISYVTYNSKGVFNGNYALNVSVPRDFAAASETVEPTEPSVPETTEPEATEPTVPDTTEPAVPNEGGDWVAMPEEDKGEASITQNVGTLSSGSYYLLRSRTANKYLTGTASGNRLNFGTANTEYWYVTKAGSNTYYIQYGGPDGQYLTIGNDSAKLSNTATAITMSYVNTDNAYFWDIQQGNQHLNNYRAESRYASGWSGAASGDDGSCWYLDLVSFGSRSYVLDTDGMNPGEAYLILDDDQAKALTLSGTTVGNANVTVKDNKVSISGSAADYEFYFAANSKESGSYLLTQDGSRTIKHSGGNLQYVSSSDGEYHQGYWHVEHAGNGLYRVYDINGNNWYLNYGYVWGNESTSRFAVSSNSRNVRLFKYTETGSAGGYARLVGETNQIYVTADAATESDVLGKVTIQTSADGVSIDSTQVPVTGSMISWDKAFNGTAAGTYVGTISYEGNVLGTVTVTITLEHKYETTTVEATCTQDGSVTTKCAVCGEQTVEVIKAPGHNYTCQETAATCGKDGAKVYTCAACADTYTEVIPATGAHAWEITTLEATCTQDGSVTTKCTVCGEQTVEVIAASGHNYTCRETAATCGKDGSKVYTCENCADTYTEVIPATGDHGYEAVTVEATCTTAGSTTYTCSVCGKSYSETIPATGKHIYKSETVAATCTQDGSVTYTCGYCGDTYVETISAVGHAYVCTVTEATCTTAGSKVYTCTVCGDTYTEEIAALGHDYQAVVTAPTCTEGGFTTYTCGNCGHSYVDDATAALGHRYETATVEATCTQDGSVTYYCVCGHSYSEVIPSAGHSYQTVVTAPTCTEGGYTTHTCGSCGESYVSDEMDALGHSNTTQITNPTCTAGGYTADTCTVCGEYRIYNEVDALGHDYDSVTVDPTETEGGYTTHTCTVCGHSYTDNYMDALGHTIVSVVTDPTCTEEGYTTHTCATCGEETVDTYVPALGHDYQTVTVDATCTADGSVTKTCARCADTSTEVIGAYGHAYEATVTAPTCTEGGHTVYSCARCGDNYVSDLTEATGHNHTAIKVDVTCTQDGYTTYLCTNCGDSYEGDTAAALGHDYQTVTADATCTEDGSVTHICSRCGDSYSETIPASGHDHEAVITEATCTAEGYTTYTCRCGDSYVADKIPATGHDYDCVEENGNQIYTCDSCGDTYTVTIGWVALDGTYVLDTDGLDTGADNKYLVVGADHNQALTLSGTTVGNASVQISGNTITLDDAAKYEFYFQPSGNKLLLTQDGNKTVYHQNANMYYGTNTAGHWTVTNKGSGKYNVLNQDGNGNWSLNYGYVWGNDSSNKFAVSYYERHVRLYKATDSYARLYGTLNQTMVHGADATVAAVLGKVQIQTSADGIAANGNLAVDSSMITWDKTFDGYTAGTYTATVTYKGQKLGTITVNVTGEHTYDSAVKEATCTEAGYTTHTCTVCGHNYTDGDTAALGHSYTSVETADSIVYTCSRCGHSYSESLGMTYTKVTSISGGNNYVITLVSGNKYYAVSHKNNSISAVQVTVSGDQITSEITEDLVWTYSSNKLSYKSGNTTYYLYAQPAGGWWGWWSAPTLTISSSNSTSASFSNNAVKMSNYYLRYSNGSISLNSSATTTNLFIEK